MTHDIYYKEGAVEELFSTAPSYSANQREQHMIFFIDNIIKIAHNQCSYSVGEATVGIRVAAAE